MSTGPELSGTIPRLPDSAMRVELEVVRGSEIGKTVDCARVVTLLGSRAGCKLQLKHSTVSAVHLAIVNDGVHAMAVDLITGAGSFLNDLKLENEGLNDGDVLGVGPWEFNIHFRKTDVPAIAPRFDLEPTPQVVAFEHLDSGRILQPNRAVCVIGRRKGCDIFITSKRVSRVHALLITHQGHPALVDLLSTQHTLVNDEPVAFRVLKDLDIVTVADARFRVRTLQSPAGKPTTRNETGPVKLAPADEPVKPARDQIDIGNVEGSQTWRIAESFDRVSKHA